MRARLAAFVDDALAGVLSDAQLDAKYQPHGADLWTAAARHADTAACRDEPRWQCMLGVCYARGCGGVAVDRERAIGLLKQAARAALSHALFALGEVRLKRNLQMCLCRM